MASGDGEGYGDEDGDGDGEGGGGDEAEMTKVGGAETVMHQSVQSPSAVTSIRSDKHDIGIRLAKR